MHGIKDVVSVDAGVRHTCALTVTGGVRCWGWNKSGQIGDGTTRRRLKPTRVSGLSSGIVAIATGADHSCAVTEDGAVKCWGNSLGIGTAQDQSEPVDIPGLASGVVAITAGGVHTCALTDAGAALCWGKNYYGQLGDGTDEDRSDPTPVSGLDSGVASITAGRSHTCAVTSGGRGYCWGYGRLGRLGTGSGKNEFEPVRVGKLGTDAAFISGGGDHTCAG